MRVVLAVLGVLLWGAGAKAQVDIFGDGFGGSQQIASVEIIQTPPHFSQPDSYGFNVGVRAGYAPTDQLELEPTHVLRHVSCVSGIVTRLVT